MRLGRSAGEGGGRGSFGHGWDVGSCLDSRDRDSEVGVLEAGFGGDSMFWIVAKTFRDAVDEGERDCRLEEGSERWW